MKRAGRASDAIMLVLLDIIVIGGTLPAGQAVAGRGPEAFPSVSAAKLRAALTDEVTRLAS